MPTLSEWYVTDADGTRKYFKDIRAANEFAKQVANVTRQTAIRYDIYGGQSWFYPDLGASSKPEHQGTVLP